MNILILNWKDIKNPDVGGAEIIAFEFARRLAHDGHTVTYFCSRYKTSVPEETIDGIKIVRKGSLYTVYLHAIWYYLGLKKKPDKVLEMINTICWQTWLYVPKKKRIAYLNQLAKEVWFYQFPRLLAAVGFVLERLEYLPYTNTDFLCYSKSTKEDLISYGVTSSQIRLFPLGIDHGRYMQKGKKSPTPLFVFVARLVKMKRADLCVKAMQTVVQQFPDAKLVIIGNGAEEPRLKDMIVSNNLTKHVSILNKNNFFVDKHPGDIKLEYMQKAWALLLPSVKEGWGMVVTEAAACGTPAIVSDVTGLRDSVRNGESGLVVSKNPTAQELAHEMIRLISDKKLRESLSQGAKQWSKQFTWDRSYREFKKPLLAES